MEFDTEELILVVCVFHEEMTSILDTRIPNVSRVVGSEEMEIRHISRAGAWTELGKKMIKHFIIWYFHRI